MSLYKKHLKTTKKKRKKLNNIIFYQNVNKKYEIQRYNLPNGRKNTK